MKKSIAYIFLFSAFFTVSCAFLQMEDPKSIPSPFNVNTNSQFYFDALVAPITFTGDPEADFGVTRKIFADPAWDATNLSGLSPSTNFRDITDIYLAFSMNNLLIGFKSPSYPDNITWDVRFTGGAYIFIDNGIYSGDYSKGPVILGNSGLTAAGISGQLGSWEDLDLPATNGHKFSFMFKNYRPATKDCQVYCFIDGYVQHEVFSAGSSTVGWNNYTANGVTEVAIPLHYIFGGQNTNMNTFYLAFRIDSAGTENGLATADPNGTNRLAFDWAPANPIMSYIITNWIMITQMNK